jgi:hypothetical protein
MKKYDRLIEELAELENAQWKYWRKSIENKFRVPHHKNLDVKYSELSESDKELDRIWAKKAILVIIRHLHRISDESDFECQQ